MTLRRRILRALQQAGRPLSAPELARACGASPKLACNMLAIMRRAGQVSRVRRGPVPSAAGGRPPWLWVAELGADLWRKSRRVPREPSEAELDGIIAEQMRPENLPAWWARCEGRCA